MRRHVPAALFALAFAAAPLAAQDTARPQAAPAKAGAEKSVLLAGCLSGGPSSYTLSNVAVTRVAHETADRPVGTSGASTSYHVTARDGVDLGDYVGKKVEVTGVLMPVTAQKDPAAQPHATSEAHPDVKAAQTRAAVAASTDPKVAATAVKLLSATCQ